VKAKKEIEDKKEELKVVEEEKIIETKAKKVVEDVVVEKEAVKEDKILEEKIVPKAEVEA